MIFFVVCSLCSPHALRPVERALHAAAFNVTQLTLYALPQVLTQTTNHTLDVAV